MAGEDVGVETVLGAQGQRQQAARKQIIVQLLSSARGNLVSMQSFRAQVYFVCLLDCLKAVIS